MDMANWCLKRVSFSGGMVKTATDQNGDKPKRLQVQSKRINLLSSTMDPFSILLTKFQLIQLCSFAVQSLVCKISWAQICLALTSGIARNGILYFFHITKQLHAIYVYSLRSIIYASLEL